MKIAWQHNGIQHFRCYQLQKAKKKWQCVERCACILSAHHEIIPFGWEWKERRRENIIGSIFDSHMNHALHTMENWYLTLYVIITSTERTIKRKNSYANVKWSGRTKQTRYTWAHFLSTIPNDCLHNIYIYKWNKKDCVWAVCSNDALKQFHFHPFSW